MCAYNLSHEDCQTAFGHTYKAADMVLDACKYGNIGKFINDNKYRGDGEDEAQLSNVKVLWVYDKLPHLLFYATEDIEAGEELIQDYGHEFWSITSRQILVDQWRYHNYIIPYNKELTALCEELSIPLPKKPSYLLESYKFFDHKPLSYPLKWKDSSTHDVRHRVERILDKRHTEGGGVQYLIKWRGFPDALQSWEGTEQLSCDALLERFEVLQALNQSKIKQLSAAIIKHGLPSARDYPDSESDVDDIDEELFEMKQQDRERQITPLQLQQQRDAMKVMACTGKNGNNLSAQLHRTSITQQHEHKSCAAAGTLFTSALVSSTDDGSSSSSSQSEDIRNDDDREDDEIIDITPTKNYPHVTSSSAAAVPSVQLIG
jgi:hypothetical protein